MVDKPVLTARDTELLAIAMRCAKDPGGFQVDYTKMAELANLKNPKTATTVWSNVRKKLMPPAAPAGDSSAADGDDAAASAQATPAKAKTPAKKRAPAKPNAKAGTEFDADGDNGVAADDEQTPVNTPKRKGGAKRKAPEPSSPIKAEDDTTDNAAAHGEDFAAEEAPAKKKRVRKPKDPNAPPPKPRVKKEAKAAKTPSPASTTTVENEHDNDNFDAANMQMLDDAEGEVGVEAGGEEASIFGDGNIKVEGSNELDPYEQEYVQEALA